MSSPSASAHPQLGPSGRTAVVVLVAAVLVAMLALPVRSWFLQQARIAEAHQQLDAAQTSIEDMQEQKVELLDKSYLEQQARERLNYVYPGEVGIVVLQPASDDAGAQPETWYGGLWQTVQSASGRGETAVGDPVQVRPSAPR